jgi:urease accessory protein
MTAASDPSGLTALLLLGDGRFPAGGHAHSAGVEAAVADGRIRDLASLDDFVTGRLHAAGLVDAALAAATVLTVGGSTLPVADLARVLVALDGEATARITAPPLRVASRRLGRQILRVAGRCWPSPLVTTAVDLRPEGIHNPIALGVVAVAAGLTARSAAALSVHHAVTTPAQAAVRLLGLDPFEVAALTARVDRQAASVVAEAVEAAEAVAADPDPLAALARLPACAAPVVEIAAVDHAAADMRLFAT